MPRITLKILESGRSFSHVEEPDTVFALPREFAGSHPESCA